MGSKGALEEPDEGVGVLYHQMWNGKRMKDTKKKKRSFFRESQGGGLATPQRGAHLKVDQTPSTGIAKFGCLEEISRG